MNQGQTPIDSAGKRGLSPISGKVWLVGAGPGDPELLTLKAVRALGEADVVIMGVSNLPRVAAALRNAGMPQSMPAAAIQDGTTSNQRQVVATLETIEADVASSGIASPALLVFGEVVALAKRTAAARTLQEAA